MRGKPRVQPRRRAAPRPAANAATAEHDEHGQHGPTKPPKDRQDSGFDDVATDEKRAARRETDRLDDSDSPLGEATPSHEPFLQETDVADPLARHAPSQRRTAEPDELINEASEESFPASDPPAHTGMTSP